MPFATRGLGPAFSSFFLSSPSTAPALRIGILSEGEKLSEAFASVLDDIQSCDFARIELVIISSPNENREQQRSSKVGWKGWLRALRRQPWELYAEADRRRAMVEDPLAVRDCSPILEGIARTWIDPSSEGNDDGSRGRGLQRARDAELDVILAARWPHPDPVLAGVARYGVWFLECGGRVQDASCFWEMAESRAVTEVHLRRLADRSGDALILASGQFATHAGSLARNRAQAYFGTTHLVIQKLRELHEFGWQHVLDRSIAATSDHEPPPVLGTPSNLELGRWLLPLIANRLGRRLARSLNRDAVEHWRIAVRARHQEIVTGTPLDMSGFRWLESPRQHYFADPFLAEHDGGQWLFFEDYSYATNRGVISCCKVQPNGSVSEPQVVLAAPGHLSYPFVFVDGDVPYMIPEAAADGAVCLYRALEFPGKWTLEAELYAGRAVDTSSWQEDGTWFFLTTLLEPRGSAGMLMLFQSESVQGPWISHPSNPISLNITTVRNAGGLFREKEKLFRPSQDGSHGYGSSFSLNEILALSSSLYTERLALTVGPDWSPGLVGTHTYNRNRQFEVTDGKTLRRRNEVA